MGYHDYEYDYHNLADDADFIEQDEYYYDDGSDEPWMDEDDSGWENSSFLSFLSSTFESYRPFL
jgi:hypothetical protein